MQEEEAGPPVVIGGGAALPFGGAVSYMPRGVPSVCAGRGAAGGTAASHGAPARIAPAPARAPVCPAPAPGLVVCIQRGSLPSCEARPARDAVRRRAPSPLPVNSGKKEYEDDVDIS